MLNLLHIKKINIFDQLKLEEYLLKNTKDSFCIINEKTPPAIVMGVCNKQEELLNTKNIKKDKIPIIKRFTGGGSVFVDENTLFVTFIFSKDFLKIDLFPEAIIKWAKSFYKKVLKIKDFKAIENDFVINNKKIAGNAKYIKKDRFLLHTSFLIDFEKEKMNKYLLFPKKAPLYRKKRSHEEFLCPLKDYFSKDEFIFNLKKQLKTSFKINPVNFSEIKFEKINFSTKLINKNSTART